MQKRLLKVRKFYCLTRFRIRVFFNFLNRDLGLKKSFFFVIKGKTLISFQFKEIPSTKILY